MKNRKLISLISAIAMTATVFTPFSFADAATDVLWSDTFNSYENVGYKTDEDDPTVVPDSAKAIGPTLCQSYRQAATYDGIEGILMSTGSKGDDSSYFQINEKADNAYDKYVTTAVARFSNQGRGSNIQFTDGPYTPADGKDLVLTFDAMLQDATDDSAVTYSPGIVIGDMELTNDSTTAASGEWHSYKMVVTSSGSTLYMDGVSVGVSSDTSISQINFQDPSATGDAQKAATHPLGYPIVGIDNIVVYNADNGVTDETPAAETKGEAATPSPTPAPEAAPEITVPSGNTTIVNNNFNSAEVGTIVSLGTEAQEEPATVDGINYYIGSRSDGADSASRARIVQNLEGDNILSLESGQYATAGRGPVIEIANDVDVTNTGVASTMEFAVRLSSSSKSGAGRLYFLKDRTQTGSDGTGAYRNVAFVLGTDDDVELISRGDNGTDFIGKKVEAGVWHTVKFELGEDQIYRVYVDDDEPFKGDYVASGDNATQLSNLPMLAVQSSNASGTNYFSIAEIDNLVAYYAVDSGETPIPTTQPTEQPSTGITLTPSQDTYVDSEDDVDHSEATAMKINKESPTQKTIIGFDTASLAGQTITSAKLKIKVAPRSYKESDSRYENTGLSFAITTDEWESGILKNGLDSLSATTVNDELIWTDKYPAATSDIVAPYQDIEVDVTDALTEALSANSSLVSFIVTASTGRTHDIASMEDADNAPKLVVELSGDAPIVTEKPTDAPEPTATPKPTPVPVPDDEPVTDAKVAIKSVLTNVTDNTATFDLVLEAVDPSVQKLKGIGTKIDITDAYTDVTSTGKVKVMNNGNLGVGIAYTDTDDYQDITSPFTIGSFTVTVANPVDYTQNYWLNYTEGATTVDVVLEDGSFGAYSFSDDPATIQMVKPVFTVEVAEEATPSPSPTTAPKVVVAIKDGFTDAQITEVAKDTSGNQYLVITAVDKDGNEIELVYGVDFVATYNGEELTADEYANLINGYTDPISDVINGLKLNVLNDNVGVINAAVAVAEPGETGTIEVEGSNDIPVNGLNTPTPSPSPTPSPTEEPTSSPTSSPTKKPSTPGSLSGGSGGSSSSSDDDWYWAMYGTGTTTTGFSVKLSAAELAKGGTPTYGGTLTGNVFKADVKVNGVEKTSYTGFDPVLVKAKYTLASAQNLYNVVAVNQSTGEIVKRSLYDGSQMNAALKDTAVQYAIVEQPLASYDDVSQAWAREAISALSVRNIIAGVGNNLYDPDANVTRAQFAKLIIEAMDVLDTTATLDFTDVAADAWYAPYVATAQKLGIVTGIGYGMFDPDASITRQDMATMLFRAADVLSIPLASTAAIMTYADEAEITEYAQTPVYRMQQADIMKGTGDSMFEPQAYTTRAQAAVAIFNIFKVSMTNITTWNF